MRHRPASVTRSSVPDFCEKAGVLPVRLTKNHPLLDGNKRAAWVSLRVFVEMNLWTWTDYPSDDAAGASCLPLRPEIWTKRVASWLREVRGRHCIQVLPWSRYRSGVPIRGTRPLRIQQLHLLPCELGVGQDSAPVSARRRARGGLDTSTSAHTDRGVRPLSLADGMLVRWLASAALRGRGCS